MLNRQTRCCCCCCCLHYFAEVLLTSITPVVIPSVGACPNEGSPGEQQHSVPSGGGLRALLGRSFIGVFEVCQLCLFCIFDSQRIIKEVVVVVVFFTLTDRASTIQSNIRGCQSGTWSQRGTKVNGSHYGDNLLLRLTGIQIATKSYATLQAMAPTNNKTVHQTSFTPYREQPRSTRIVVAYPLPAFSGTNRTHTFQPVLINNSKFLKATHRTKIRKVGIPRSMVVEALSWWSRRASQHPAVQSPVHP